MTAFLFKLRWIINIILCPIAAYVLYRTIKSKGEYINATIESVINLYKENENSITVSTIRVHILEKLKSHKLFETALTIAPFVKVIMNGNITKDVLKVIVNKLVVNENIKKLALTKIETLTDEDIDTIKRNVLLFLEDLKMHKSNEEEQ